MDSGHGFPQTPTETARTDSGHSVLGAASLGQVCSPVSVVGDFDLGYQGEHNGGGVVLRSLLPGVPMVQTTQERHGNHDGVRIGLLLYWPPVRRVLLQGVVNAVVVVVVHVIANEPPQMSFV